MSVFHHFPQERVHFGEAFDDALCAEADALDAQRVFVMASATLARDTDLVTRLRQRLGARFAGVATGMPSHTPRDAVLAMASAARAAQADLLVTFGGGSLTDGGKMVRLCLEHGVHDADGFESLRTVIHADGTTTEAVLRAPRVAQVAIPTTLSGGEFGITAGCTDTHIPAKHVYRHRRLIPQAVILDPRVTLHTPEWLWLSTGMRAVDHCVETLCSHLAHFHSDGAALNGLRLLAAGLPRSKADAGDLEARLMCQVGAWQSMDHNQSGVPMGASHGIGHVLGGACNVPHGHTSCVMLPAALRWNAPVNAHQQARVSEAMGHPGVDAAEVIEEFVRALGQPGRLSEVGVGREQFDLVATQSMHDRYIHSNPRPITDPAQVLEILELAA